jgi:hypothetical protein
LDRVSGRECAQEERVTLKRIALLATTIVLASVPVLMAVADHRDVSDGNDTRGPLDVSLARMSSGRPPGWVIRTRSKWNAFRIFDRGFIVIRLDTFGDGEFDYYALVRSNRKRISAWLYADRGAQADRRKGRLGLKRGSRKSIQVWVPFRKLRFSQKRPSYAWIVETLWTARRCPRVCIDRVPNRGTVLEPREPTPAPTPSITPSVSPSVISSLTG